MADSTRKFGMMFTTAAWILGFLLLALVFSGILDRQANPNRQVATLQSGGSLEVSLQRNRAGHYVFDGEINHRPVTFLVDTGATTTAIPGQLQRTLGLEPGAPLTVSTANGRTTAYLTRLDQLAIGGIVLNNVQATIIPGMGVDEVLLGMNVLKHFELVQRGNELIIRTQP
ncbi:MAG: TIGR02281 family clan AA aspartic protease [Gammaproteobacteria bacterium]|nr:TIGR02281 family clan AA aspartic protease [Gammaproteobacteria bacterium]